MIRGAYIALATSAVLWGPSVAYAQACGDGVRAGDEECDGSDLGDASCEALGYPGGVLSCTDACTLSTRTCDTCGDEVLDEGEACDGAVPEGLSCGDFGFDGGELGCAADCEIDTDACLNDLCGDGVADSGEDCDGDDLAGTTCGALGYDGGELGCTRACTFEVSGCEGEVDRLCGNGVLEVGEACDGTDFGGATCVSLDYAEGELACTATCALDERGCVGGATDVSRDTGGQADTGEPSGYEDTGGSETPNVEVTPITIGCCGVEGGEPVETDTASLGLAFLVLGWMVRRRRED